jgi:hypothetical protein
VPPPPSMPTTLLKQIVGLVVAIFFCVLGRAATYVLSEHQLPIYHAFTFVFWVCGIALAFVIVRWLIKGGPTAR